MKAWVNKTLADGYYTIAEIDAKIAEIKSGAIAYDDTEIKAAIDEQVEALEQAKKDLTAAYEKAITDAINTNNGVTNATVATAVNDAKDILQSQIDTIDTKLDELSSRVEILEKIILPLILLYLSIPTAKFI